MAAAPVLHPELVAAGWAIAGQDDAGEDLDGAAEARVHWTSTRRPSTHLWSMSTGLQAETLGVRT